MHQIAFSVENGKNKKTIKMFKSIFYFDKNNQEGCTRSNCESAKEMQKYGSGTYTNVYLDKSITVYVLRIHR